MSRKSHLLRKYGITEEQYDELLEKQGHSCAVCRRHHREFKTRLCVDHDHSSLAVRGLLCTYCNRRVVGRYRRETAKLLLAAYEYLIREYPGWVTPKVKKNGSKRRRRNHRSPAKRASNSV